MQVKDIVMTKVDELQEELNVRIKERSSHGKTFDEIDLLEMEQKCKITGIGFEVYSRYRGNIIKV